MATRLDGTSGIQSLERGYVIIAPGVSGQVEEVEYTRVVQRSESSTRDKKLFEAIKSAQFKHETSFDIETVTQDVLSGGQRSPESMETTARGEPAMIMGAPKYSGENIQYLALYTVETDKGSIQRWILPEKKPLVAHGKEMVEYHIPRQESAPPDNETDTDSGKEIRTQRGGVMKFIRRSVNFFILVTEDALGWAFNKFASWYEGKARPYYLQYLEGEKFSPLDHSEFVKKESDNKEFNPDTIPWDRFTNGRTLLLIHGTFSTNNATYLDLVKNDIMKALIEKEYGGRVLAFNHPSVHASVEDNIAKFAEYINERSLEFDIITHSRGGLVARELVRQLNNQSSSKLSNVTVRKVIFVAAPNNGTIVVDSKHWIDLVDRYTNLLTFLPDTLYTVAMEGVLLVLKLIQHAGFNQLRGLNAMLPPISGGQYLQDLNGSALASDIQFYSISRNYEPTDSMFKLMRKNKFGGVLEAFDLVFGKKQNDGVVPTRGSYNIEQTAAGFPIQTENANLRALGSDKDDTEIHHCNYFVQDSIIEILHEFLSES